MRTVSMRNSGRRAAAVRAGLFAISGVVAGLSTAIVARGDITNSFSGFSALNTTGTIGNGIGYSANGNSFETTDGGNGEATSGFSTAVQNITSFDASFIYTASGSADGGAFVLQNIGATALGQGGGAGGYQGIGSASAALELEFYGGSQVGFSTAGATPSNYASTQNASVNSGDPIQVTVEYFNNTVTANFVDLTTGAAGARIFANQNIAAAVGGSTALVGFSGATGGLASTQTVSNFTFISGQSALGARVYNPISVTGYNQQGIISVALGQAAVTATMDRGTNFNATSGSGDTWYEKGWNTFNTSTGLPTSGSTFTSSADSSHSFKMANYSSNDVVLLNSTSTGQFNFSAPSTYSALSFLTASGNGPSSFKVTITYSDGAPASTGLSVISPDWFNGSPSAWTANGRDTLQKAASAQPDNYAGGQPNLYEEDLILPDSSDPIASISMTYAAGGNIMVFAVSGVASSNNISLVYNGATTTAGKFDNSTLTFGLNTASGTPTAFSNGAVVTFDDTAADTAHNITVATVSSGIKPGALIFNNSTGTAPYTFTGAAISGVGGLTINGNGTVVFNNPNTFTGDTNIYGGTLVLGTNGKLASNNIALSGGTFLNVSGGALTGTAITLTDAGTVNYAPTTLSLIGLNGSGVLNSTNGAATALTLTGSGTYSGSMNLGTGSVTVNANGSNGSTAVLSGSNSYTGGTFIKAGALEIGLPNSLGSGTVTLQGGSFGASAASVAFSNLITGSALILPAGSNILELSGSNNTFTGPVVIQSSATLQLDYPGSIGGLDGTNASSGNITVASGGSLLIRDNNSTNTIGLTGGAAKGAPITATLSGSGVGSNGALRGADGATVTWAGNVNISGPAQISPGVGGTLTLSGAITGNGQVLYASNRNDSGSSAPTSVVVLAPPTATSNTYTGESQVTGDYSAFGAFQVQLGNSNGFSPNAGLNFVTGTSYGAVVDLYGFNQSVQYLTGAANSAYTLTNSQGTASTLTINNGSNGTVAQNLGVQITGNLSVVKTGAGHQILSGSNNYSGTTTISQGVLSAANSSAFSNGAVVLNGGTLGLYPILSAGTPILNANSLTSFTGVVANGSSGAAPSYNSGVNALQLTYNVGNTAAAAYYPTPVPVSDKYGFTASFTYSVGAGYADGFTFLLQNDPRGTAAVGAGGGELGYGGATGTKIVNSAAVEFNIYSFAAAGEGTQFNSSGAVPGDANTPNGTFINTAPVNLALRQVGTVEYLDPSTINVNLIYDGPAQTLTETLTNVGENTTFTTVFTGIDYSALVGGAAGGSTTAYLGFTGGEGGVGSAQNISNLSYSTNLSQPQGISNAINATSGISAIRLGINAGTTNTGGVVGQINISTGATVAVTIPTNTSTGRGVLFTPLVSIATTTGGAFVGKLDLGSNDLVVTGSSLSAVTAMVASGYNAGKWNGSGIASSVAAADTAHLTALGVILNDNGGGVPLYGNNGTIASNLDGSIPSDGNILVKFTYYGDANLDGAVDGSDYSLIDSAFTADKLNPAAYTGWQNGDFNYDGVINGSDYTLIDNAFNSQGTSLGSNPLAQIASQVSGSAVPEPTTLSLLAIGTTGLLSRRKRRM